MAVQGYDILLAVSQGRRAIRRGDLDAAERWFKLAERACGIEVRLGALARADARAGPQSSAMIRPRPFSRFA